MLLSSKSGAASAGPVSAPDAAGICSKGECGHHDPWQVTFSPNALAAHVMSGLLQTMQLGKEQHSQKVHRHCCICTVKNHWQRVIDTVSRPQWYAACGLCMQEF